jgi:hypothetical protein
MIWKRGQSGERDREKVRMCVDSDGERTAHTHAHKTPTDTQRKGYGSRCVECVRSVCL